MNLTHRLVTEEDLAISVPTLAPCYGNNPEIIPELPAVWCKLLRAGAMVSSLVEDKDRPSDDRIVALGASVFVHDDFLAEARTALPPYLGAQIVRRILRGNSSVLDRAAIRLGNARGGLNLCILHFDFPHLPPEQLPDPNIHEKHFQAFFHYHPRYCFKDFVREVRGEAWRRWMLAAGAELQRDYAEYFAASSTACPAPEQWPYLMGLSREQSAQREGSRIFPLFLNAPVRFGFTGSQRALLLYALDGQTDEELAASLFLSLSAVKKRWFSVYDRVERIAGDLLPMTGGSLLGGKRGSERRRFLLNYLREHPEELHSPDG